ncbi:MAG: phosphotyrosine protein phosphatase [Chloroflexi bacterium]|nr:phosphotyrosine protein phosphatase [Chloroflexota bacterium]
MSRLLFVCSQNRWRSPTAEQVFSEYPGVECLSAGLNHDAENPLTPELVEWAEVIFVMEREHKARLSARFKPFLAGKRVVCLDIPDDYRLMEPSLVTLLKVKVKRFLPHEQAAP